MTDNSVQEARIQSNDLTNVATAAAALNTHLNSLTFNNTHNNITNTNIQVLTSEMIISCQVELTLANPCLLKLQYLKKIR